jgi:hypothetical protein
MNIEELLDTLNKSAKEYAPDACKSIIRNCHMNNLYPDSKVDPDTVDAVIVDFVNYIASTYCVDYAMYTKDLRKESD